MHVIIVDSRFTSALLGWSALVEKKKIIQSVLGIIGVFLTWMGCIF